MPTLRVIGPGRAGTAMSRALEAAGWTIASPVRHGEDVRAAAREADLVLITVGGNDLEAGMAKYLASEYCSQVVEDSFRIHGGYGYSKEYEIERLYREAAFMLIGEGTSDIQKMIIGRAMLKEYKLKG